MLARSVFIRGVWVYDGHHSRIVFHGRITWTARVAMMKRDLGRIRDDGKLCRSSFIANSTSDERRLHLRRWMLICAFGVVLQYLVSRVTDDLHRDSEVLLMSPSHLALTLRWRKHIPTFLAFSQCRTSPPSSNIQPTSQKTILSRVALSTSPPLYISISWIHSRDPPNP